MRTDFRIHVLPPESASIEKSEAHDSAATVHALRPVGNRNREAGFGQRLQKSEANRNGLNGALIQSVYNISNYSLQLNF